MGTEVYFVRHAHSIFSLEDEETRGLSEKGWEDAKRITDILLEHDLDHIMSSTYVRAIQTVEGIASKLQKEIELDFRFRERDLAARDYHFEDPLGAMKYAFDHPTYSYPGGESNLEVQERGISGLRDIVEKYKGKRIAVGIHGNIMVCTMNYFDSDYNFDFWKSTTKPDLYKLTIGENFTLLDCERLWNDK